MEAVRRGLPVLVVLLAAYALTLGLDATPGERYSAAETHRLLVAESIVSDGDLDLRDEFAQRAWERWDGRAVDPRAQLTNGRLHEPDGIGFPLLVAPAYALGGAGAVEAWLAFLLALAFAVAAAVARRIVPDPWPVRGALVVGLSPPALAASTQIAPSTAGALLLVGSIGLALRAREDPRLVRVVGAVGLAVLLPWLAIGLAVPALAAAAVVALVLSRAQRGLASFAALEVVVMGAVLYVAVNDRLFGGPTPDFARAGGVEAATGVASVGDVMERLPRLVGVLVDEDVGLLRWAPVLVLAGLAAVLLVRSRRERLALVVPGRGDVEVAVGLLLVASAAGLVVAALAPRSLGGGPWLVAHHAPVVLPLLAVLCAWAWPHAERVVAALAGVTFVGSAWLLVAARIDDDASLSPARGALPWGGLEAVLPRFAEPVTWPALVACGTVVAATAAGVAISRRSG